MQKSSSVNNLKIDNNLGNFKTNPTTNIYSQGNTNYQSLLTNYTVSAPLYNKYEVEDTIKRANNAIR